MTRRIVLIATLVVIAMPATATASSSFLHLSEAKTMQQLLARDLKKQLRATYVDLGNCYRVSSRRASCPVIFRRTFRGIREKCPYTVRVRKWRSYDGRTWTRATTTGYCGSDE